MRLRPLPASVYADRVKRLQMELKRESVDVFVGYSSECESAASRFLAGFWPFFDFSSIVVPAVILGPRGDNLHAPDEWVLVEDILSLTGIYALLAYQWSG
jgi:acetylornithine deacetylase/succinyl-diaminopimelate desuccinylase-like protein